MSGLNIALLIDFDNVILGIEDPGFDVELVVNALRERGSIVMGRAYGDWYRHNRHRRKLMEQGLELVETPAFGPVIKNSADIRIALDGFEIAMTQHHIDTFCLVSGDSDFLPLVKKLQYLGKKVLVICGNKFTSDMLRRNCNEFVSYENLLAQSVGATEDATTLEGAFALLHRGIAALRDRGSETRSSTVKQMMLQLNPVFSERTFGCNQFRQFLDKAVYDNLIKLGSRDRVSGEFMVLLPDDEETQVEAKSETRIERPERTERTGRRERTPRAERAAGGVSEDAAAPQAAPAEATPALPVPPGSDLFQEPTVSGTREEAVHHATTTSTLLERGLRRGRLRFTGRKSEPEPTGNAPEVRGFDGTPLPSPEDLWRADETPKAPSASEALNEVAVAVAHAAAQAEATGESAGNVLETATPTSSNTAPDDTTEAAESGDQPRARSRSRRRRKPAERAVNETAPASDAEAVAREEEVQSAGLAFPGVAYPVDDTSSTPSEAPTPAAADDAPAVETATTAGATTAGASTAGASSDDAPEPKKRAPRRRAPRKKPEAGGSEAAPAAD